MTNVVAVTVSSEGCASPAAAAPAASSGRQRKASVRRRGIGDPERAKRLADPYS
jgi:hypothetical protein